MGGMVILILLATTTALVVAILLVLTVILRHGRRVERLAEETHTLLEHVERNTEREPQGEKDGAPKQ